jgi:integrase/recombinase XerD
MSSLYRRGDVWYLKYRKDGKWVYKSLKTSDREQAEKDQADMEIGLGLQQHNMEMGVSWKTIADNYRRWGKTHLAPATLYLRLLAVKNFTEATGLEYVNDVTPQHIEEFKAWRRRRKEKPQKEGEEPKILEPNTPRTVNESLQGLKSVVGRAIKQGWYSGKNPFAGVDPVPEPKRRPRWLTQTQIETVLAKAKAHSRDLYLVFALGIYAGLRKGEIGEARWEWIDWDAGLIHVEWSETKDREPRTVPFSEKLQAILTPYKAAKGFVVAPAAVRGRGRYRYDFKKAFRTVVKNAGVPWATPHTLRHTFASQLASAGVSLYKIQQWLGHSDANTTQVYAHLQPRDRDIDRL